MSDGKRHGNYGFDSIKRDSALKSNKYLKKQASRRARRANKVIDDDGFADTKHYVSWVSLAETHYWW